MNRFGCQLEVFDCAFQKFGNKKPSVVNQNDLFINYLAMNCNGQIAKYG